MKTEQLVHTLVLYAFLPFMAACGNGYLASPDGALDVRDEPNDVVEDDTTHETDVVETDSTEDPVVEAEVTDESSSTETEVPKDEPVETTDFIDPIVSEIDGNFVTHVDRIPDFARDATVTSSASGPWSSPSTWSEGRVPGTGDRVVIRAGDSVSYDLFGEDRIAALTIRGTLEFSRTTAAGKGTKILVGTTIVAPTGELRIGAGAEPMPDNHRAAFIFLDSGRAPGTMTDPLTGVEDPEQFAGGLIVLGRIAVYGAPRDPTYVRLDREPKAGDTTLHFQAPVHGWEVGDALVVPDTRHFSVDHEKRATEEFYDKGRQTEVRTIVRDIGLVLQCSIQLDGREPRVDPHSANG
jgi:hypothetical protein